MTKQQKKDPNIHCINALRVFDWITACPAVQKEIPVYMKKAKVIQTIICRDFSFNTSFEKQVFLWKDSTSSDFSGTVTVSNHSTAGRESFIHVFVNGTPEVSVANGQVRSVTLDSIQSVSVTVTSEEAVQGTLRITLNKKMTEPVKTVEDFKNIKDIECFLIDRNGDLACPDTTPAVECGEVHSLPDRKQDDVLMPDGKTAKLQQVKVRVKGIVCIELCKCWAVPIPFILEKNVWLCAPQGTTVRCEITAARCHAQLLPSSDPDVCFIVDLSIELQQDIKVFGETTLVIEGGKTTPDLRKSRLHQLAGQHLEGCREHILFNH